MANIGTMVAKLALDYKEFQAGIQNSRNQLNGWQTYTVAVQSQSAKSAGAVVATAAVSNAMAARSTRGALGGLLQGSMGVVGGIARIGISAASAYGSWRLYSIRMKNELMQNKILTDMLGRGPAGGGAGSIAWLNNMRGGLTSTRSALGLNLKSVLGLSAAVAGLGAAAIYGYGAWRKQSLGIRSELLQQKLMTEQLRQLRSGGGVMGGGAFGGGLLGGMLGGVAGMAIGHVTAAVASVPLNSLKLAADAEQAAISFEVLMGSADKARSMLAQLKTYADKSPFNVAGVNAAAQKLMNYGIQAQDVMPTMRMLGDVAAGDMEKFDRLSTAFGQTASTGRLMGQDLLQFINAGFNPLGEISKKTGESMADLKKRMEDGGISALEVKNAFAAATSDGGRFYNMTERQSSTLAGKFSTMKDGISTAMRDLGQSLVNNLDLKGWIDYVNNNVQKIPFIFKNAGTLLQLELLNWQTYAMELSPAFGQVMGDIGIVFAAGWTAMSNNANLFFKSVLAGVKETRNALAALQAGNKAAANDPRHPSQWLRTGLNLVDDATERLTGLRYRSADGLLGKLQQQVPVDLKTGRPLTLLEGAARAANRELASQKDAIKPGTDWASSFAKDFKASIAASVSGPGNAIVTAESIKNRQRELRASLVGPDGSPMTALGGMLGSSFNDSSSDGKKKKDDTATSSAALRGSSEANKIFTSSFESLQGKQLATLQSIDKTLKKPPTAQGQAQLPRFEIANF